MDGCGRQVMGNGRKQGLLQFTRECLGLKRQESWCADNLTGWERKSPFSSDSGSMRAII